MADSALPGIDEFNAALTHANVIPEKLVFDEKGTICNPAASKSSLLPPLTVLTGQGSNAEILVKGSLSKGGMGQIFLAEQSSLGRDVAVKVVAAGKSGTIAENELVVEGRVASQLEHPNIVPVHILGQSADGKPLLVMKRIEGESWKDLLLQGRNLARDIDILMTVCRALSFAHARGVLHRDVKPSNVMVGSFGEVYLLDWGIAVGFGDNAMAELPHARDIKTMAGTPQYMAPEMALPKAASIDPRTDVYLVGAVLYEIVTGRPPHHGKDLAETLFAAHRATPPTFGADVPEELASICTRALERDQAKRFQSAEELRQALAAFLSHAVARELCAEAEGRLAALRAFPDDADAGDVQRAFTECRFGFAQALRAWKHSARAKNGLHDVVELMARREIRAGRYDSARLLVAELDTRAPADLRAALDELAAKRAREQVSEKELRRLEHDVDRHVAGRERALVVFAAAVAWLVTLGALQALDWNDVFHAAGGAFALFMLGLTLVIAVAGVVAPSMRETSATRSLWFTMLACASCLALLHGAGWYYAVAPKPELAVGHTLVAMTAMTMASQDRRLVVSSFLLAAIVPLIILVDGAPYLASGVGTFVALSTMAWRWRKP